MPSVFHIMNVSSRETSWVTSLTGRDAIAQPWALVAREHPQHVETLVDWALKEGVSRLVVWGGDGTFHRVVSALWKREALQKMEVALVPAGTCNDLARLFNLSKYFWSRWESPSPDGRIMELPVGRMRWKENGEWSEEIFVNNAGFGRPRSSFEAGHGALGVLKSFTPLHVAAEWPGGRSQGIYYMALACSGPYFSGGLHFEKRSPAELGDLRLYLVPAHSKTRLALRLLRGRMGFPMADAKVTAIRAASVNLKIESIVWPQADGEPPPVDGAREVSFDILPQKARFWTLR